MWQHITFSSSAISSACLPLQPFLCTSHKRRGFNMNIGGSTRKRVYFCPTLNKLALSRHVLVRYKFQIEIFVANLLVEADSSHAYGRTDGRTNVLAHTTKLTLAFRNCFANKPIIQSAKINNTKFHRTYLQTFSSQLHKLIPSCFSGFPNFTPTPCFFCLRHLSNSSQPPG
jgi:hypothetical protein